MQINNNQSEQNLHDFANNYAVFGNLDTPWKSDPSSPYSLRQFNPSNSEDTQRLTDMDKNPNVLKFMGGDPSSAEDIDYLLNVKPFHEEDPRLIWAIVDTENKLVGWIQFYEDEILPESIKNELSIPKHALILETSYCKLFKAWSDSNSFIDARTHFLQKENLGVAYHGLRESIAYFKALNISASMPICITAYTERGNIASEKVLEKNGFKKVGITDYAIEDKDNNVWLLSL
ncbi:MAG: GNAT family N-acetyltransferase [Patescibacteria group bacterium]